MSDLLDERQLQTLRAAMDRLIPPDEFPGAWDAGCGDYLLRQLNGSLAPLLPAYRGGLNCLDAEARHHFTRDFHTLTPDEQDAMLKRIESGDVASEWSTAPRAFLSNLVNHTAEGYYADAGQGGNRDRISWRMIGFNGK